VFSNEIIKKEKEGGRKGKKEGGTRKEGRDRKGGIRKEGRDRRGKEGKERKGQWEWRMHLPGLTIV
jgi:hypothetical protein